MTSSFVQRPPIIGFGYGGGAPFDHAIRTGGGRLEVLSAHDLTDAAAPLDVSAYLAPATAEERLALGHTSGPLLDIGCGPGRIVRAAIEAGRLALGIDISPAAIAHARARGLPVLMRSVFESLPAEGGWGGVCLFDGNIGIDGDPESLIERCCRLLRQGGRMLVETHPENTRDARFEAQLVHPSGVRSEWFPWAETGSGAVTRIATSLGMTATSMTLSGRTFVVATR